MEGRVGCEVRREPLHEEPGKVLKPTVKAKRTHSVRVQWKAAKTKGAIPVRHYVLRISASGKLLKTVSVAASVRAFTIASLYSGTRYSVSVSA